MIFYETQAAGRTMRCDRGGGQGERGKSAEVAANVAWNRNGGMAITLPKRFKAARPEPAIAAGKSAEPPSVYRIFFSRRTLRVPPFPSSLALTLSPPTLSLFPYHLFAVFTILVQSLRPEDGCIIFSVKISQSRGRGGYAQHGRRCKCERIEIGKPRWIYRDKKRVRERPFSPYDHQRRRRAMDRKGERRRTVVSAIRYWPLKILVT